MAVEKFKCKLQYVIPHHALSRLIAKLAECRIPVVKNFLIKTFIKHYKIDINIAVSKQLSDYPCFNDFFTRALDPKYRPIATENEGMVSPADGIVSQSGKVFRDELFQAKGHAFQLDALLGGDKKLAEKYSGGNFVTIYLAPHDYHRVHMPLAGKLLKTIYVPGKLFSVNQHSVANIANLFCRNERLICLFETKLGEMALIMVGAMLVAGIETVWGQGETPCAAKSIVVKDYHNQNVVLEKGSEMGRFKFGSTVILLFPADTVQLKTFTVHQSISMGALIGQVLKDNKL